VEITDAYRKARRNTAIFCGIGLAWSAAQFDLKSLDTSTVGIVNISGASIPAIIACLIIYTIVQCTIEFMMQPDEIRRWRLAQVDYKITLNLVRVSLLALAASTVSRSIGTVVGVALGSLAIIIVYGALAVLLTFIIMPIRVRIRSHKGRVSAASAAIESASWSIFIVSTIYVLFLIIVGLSPLMQLPIINLFPTGKNQASALFFNITAFLIAVSIFIEVIANKKLYAFEPRTIVEESKFPDGTIGVTFRDNPKHPSNIAAPSSNKNQELGDREKL